MNLNLNRRRFIKIGTLSSMSLSLASRSLSAANQTVRVGMIGMGGRGCSLLEVLRNLENVAIPAICDIKPERNQYAMKLLADAGHAKPEVYTGNEYEFEKLNHREDLDAVIIATPWNWHTPMAVSAMKAGKYVGVEVPAALTLDECWQLIHTSEETGIPCMMLENWSFRRDNLAVLNMIRKGLFGETVHSQCSYSHDCVSYFFDEKGNARWQGEFLIKHNRDIYPTHGLGPVLSWMNINCGDRFDTMTSTATGSFGVNDYFKKKHGSENPMAKRDLKQGDIVTTVVKTAKGKTIVITNDMMLPRPYDNRWLIQGTNGIYSHERNSIYLEGISPESHTWEAFEPYQKKYEHRLWREAPTDIESRGHGGPDYLELVEFIKAVRTKGPTPLDVYDSVTMSCIVALSEESIRQNGAPVACPDFTNGRWKTKQPYFALDV